MDGGKQRMQENALNKQNSCNQILTSKIPDPRFRGHPHKMTTGGGESSGKTYKAAVGRS